MKIIILITAMVATTLLSACKQDRETGADVPQTPPPAPQKNFEREANTQRLREIENQIAVYKAQIAEYLRLHSETE